MGLEVVHELRHRVGSIVKAVIEVMNQACRSGGLGGDIENYEEHDRPPDDLPQHLITSQALSLRAVWRSLQPVIPQHSSGQSIDQ
jgi:hypothetical protein